MYLLKVFISIVVFIRFNCINCDKYTDWQSLINASVVYRENLDLDYFKNIVNSSRISQECEKSISQTLRSLNNFDDWSYQMYNSWSDFPPKGVMEGTVTDFGDYDQCLSITPNEVIGESQYCLIDISIPLPKPMPIHQNIFHKVDVLPKIFNKSANNVFVKLSKEASFFYWLSLRLGICTPNKCTKRDVRVLAETSLKNSGLLLKEINCESKSHVILNSTQLIAIFIFSSFLFIGIFATILKLCLSTKNISCYRLLEAFSIKDNLKKLFSTETSEELSCISGIRVFTIIWVLIAHSMVFSDQKLFRNAFKMKDHLTAVENQIVLQAQYSVETFFFISGLLTTYISLKYCGEKLEKFNVIGFLLSRIIRLTPQLAIFILLTTLLPLLGSGPDWNQQLIPQINNCYSNWWTNLIYLQNFIDTKNMCAVHTWYLATDMQYHFISLLVIIALLINKKFGFIVNTCITIVFTLISSVIIFIYDFPPGTINTGRDNYWANEWLHIFYYKPWPHGSVFFIGLAFGYIVFKTNAKKLSKMNKFLVWSLIILGYLICIYDTQYWVYGNPYNRWVSAFLYPTINIIWALSLATTIWMCITGNGGFINSILSWKAFIPLSRLTYSVYLTHVWIIWYYWGSKRDLYDLNTFAVLSLFSIVIFMSYLLGIVFSILFESPLFVLQKYMREYFLSQQKLINISNTCPQNFEQIKTLV